MLSPERLRDLVRLLLRDAGQLGEPLGVVLDYVECVLAVLLDQLLGGLRTDALDGAARQIAEYLVLGARKAHLKAGDSELPPVILRKAPRTLKPQLLADREIRHRAESRDYIVDALRLLVAREVEDRVAVLFVAINDIFDRSADGYLRAFILRHLFPPLAR